MTKRCLDEGLLQAYMDGELSREHTAEAVSHISACDACAAALADLESENTFFAAAFAPDESINVPTELLRSRIGAAVAQLEDVQGLNHSRSGGRSFNSFLASLSGLFTFTPQTAAAFASVLAVIAASVIYFAVIKPHGTNDVRQGSNEVASKEAPREGSEVKPPTAAPAPSDYNVSAPSQTQKKEGTGPVIIKAGYTPRRHTDRNDHLKPFPTPAEKKEPTLPGEKDYREAIASLEKTIKMGGDASLKPSLRIDYERNLAILDGAIAQTRKVAEQDPKDKDAVGFLMSAYQSKVELLTKVADQAQVSALGR
jgi:hypothetical protein